MNSDQLAWAEALEAKVQHFKGEILKAKRMELEQNTTYATIKAGCGCGAETLNVSDFILPHSEILKLYIKRATAMLRKAEQEFADFKVK